MIKKSFWIEKKSTLLEKWYIIILYPVDFWLFSLLYKPFGGKENEIAFL